MDIVTLSPKYQVVIPQRIRKLLNLKPGEKLQVISYDNRIEFVLVRDM
ncbi:MAG: AbrB family transcriptional regulator, partial [Gemmatimonadetes bacterium]|nr:AbrB family transcriptional regulator [Gemmatimonadota bacterium]